MRRLTRHRWTVFAVAVWVLALILSPALAPTPAEARVQNIGWMTYSVNHPEACVPVPYDCYVIWIFGED